MSAEPNLAGLLGTRNDLNRTLPPFAFPMAVLFGTYAVWLVFGGIVLLILSAL